MQSIYLNLIPGTVKPVINLSQFDEGREFSLTIINGASAADLTGATVTISGRKKDDTAFSYGTSDYVKGNPVVSVVGNIVTIRNTLQMAILAGDALATLTISKSASDVSTLDFIIKVQENPLDGVDISETEIPGIVALAEEQVEEAEAWAKGTKGGNPVTSDDPQYDNNAKYWSDRAAQYAAGALHYVGAVTFANIPVSGMSNGDMYNITTDFTTDNRFIEGAGISCKAGTDIAWVASVSKWDLPLVVPTTPAVTVDNAMSTSSENPLQNKVITNALAAGRISFGVDAQGNWGYKKDGADTVIPFKNGYAQYLSMKPNTEQTITLPFNANNTTFLSAFMGNGPIVAFAQHYSVTGSYTYCLIGKYTDLNAVDHYVFQSYRTFSDISVPSGMETTNVMAYFYILLLHDPNSESANTVRVQFKAGGTHVDPTVNFALGLIVAKSED